MRKKSRILSDNKNFIYEKIRPPFEGRIIFGLSLFVFLSLFLHD